MKLKPEPPDTRLPGFVAGWELIARMYDHRFLTQEDYERRVFVIRDAAKALGIERSFMAAITARNGVDRFGDAWRDGARVTPHTPSPDGGQSPGGRHRGLYKGAAWTPTQEHKP